MPTTTSDDTRFETPGREIAELDEGDRSPIQECLRRTPRERLRSVVNAVAFIEKARRAVRRGPPAR
jgi:hypothetical protein